MKSPISRLTTALCLSAALAFSLSLAAQNNNAHHPTYITIDIPGPTISNTYLAGINPSGAIIGYYEGPDFIPHGFLRHCGASHTGDCIRGATVTIFNVPGATGGTSPIAINPEGAITGYYCDSSACHGFLRSPAGDITSFDPPGALSTVAYAINPERAIVGEYGDANYMRHGFLRTADGTIVQLDAPGAGTGVDQGTYAVSINPQGEIAGYYVDSNNGYHGYVRTPDGVFTIFDAPGTNTTANAMNPRGEVTGDFFQPLPDNSGRGNTRGYVREPDGSIVTFDAGASSFCCNSTYPFAISPDGTITGFTSGGHSFIRAPNGAITLFDEPNAGFGGTLAAGINPTGAIIGFYEDPYYHAHGFLRLP